MSVLVCESIPGFSFMVGTLSAGFVLQMFVQRQYERGNDTQAYLQRKNERDNAPQAYLQPRCVRTHGHTASELRVWSGNGSMVTLTVFMITFHFLWNRSPVLPSCKELRSKSISSLSNQMISIKLAQRVFGGFFSTGSFFVNLFSGIQKLERESNAVSNILRT